MVNWGILILIIAVAVFLIAGGTGLLRTGFNSLKTGVTKSNQSSSQSSTPSTSTTPEFNPDVHITKTNTNVSNTGSGGQNISPDQLIQAGLRIDSSGHLTGVNTSTLSGGFVLKNQSNVNQGLPDFANTGQLSRGSNLELATKNAIAQQDLAQEVKLGFAGRKSGFDFIDKNGNVI